MQIQFTIHGNQEDPIRGNPIPYTRTLNHSWRKDAKRYKAWQEYVQRFFFLHLLEHPKQKDLLLAAGLLSSSREKPLTVPSRDQLIHVHAQLCWGNENHCDADNAWKGIVDALFEDDKHINCSANHCHKEGHNPKATVTILLNAKQSYAINIDMSHGEKVCDGEEGRNLIANNEQEK